LLEEKGANMSRLGRWRWCGILLVLPVCVWLPLGGCQAISNGLTKWQMLAPEAMEDPIQAVGGNGVVFSPPEEDKPLSREQLAKASPRDLAAYYSPVFVQQRTDSRMQRFPYPQEYDEIGEARLRREPDGKLKAFVAGEPRVYAIAEKRILGGREHIQLTYTAWYPAHPRMKPIDLEAADIDSCVVRITLDAENAPLFYETIAACGCFHKVFVERWLENAAGKSFGPPLEGKKYAVERAVRDAIDWEVAGVIEEPRDKPRRPVVFLKSGDHKVLGMGSAARLRAPFGSDVRPYQLLDYASLSSVVVEGEPSAKQAVASEPASELRLRSERSQEKAPFFDMNKGGKVWGAERKEARLLAIFGVDAAGQPRANDQIKLHFDQSTWGDPTIYEKFLRLPPGAL
jgi:hypothetical protein